MSFHRSKTSHTTTNSIAIARTVGVAVAMALVAVSCGSDPLRPELVETAETTPRSEAPESTVETTTTTEATTTTVAESTTTESPDEGDDGAIEGEPLDFGPSAGTGLAIVGVSFDDTLNFRNAPSIDADVLFSIGPLSDDLDMAALGDAWTGPSGVWWKVNVLGEEAWANQSFLGSLGSTVDRFDEVASELGVLMFEDVEAAALAVAETRASEDPASRIVFVGEPLAFDVGGFAVVDVLDLGDDSVKGERIRIDVDVVFDEESGEEGAQDVAFVVLTEVEITPICGRGTSGGLCV